MKYRVVIPEIDGAEDAVGKFLDDIIDAGVKCDLDIGQLSQITILEVRPTFFERVRDVLQEIYDAFAEVG